METRKCKVVMLATDKEQSPENWLLLNKDKNTLVKPLAGGEYRRLQKEGFVKVELYILSDEEIKEGDWFIANQGVHKCLEITSGDYPYKVANQYNKEKIQYQSENWLGNKIIATTDSSLEVINKGINPIYEKLPKPSQSFIEKYITDYNKDNIITEVLVEYESTIKESK